MLNRSRLFHDAYEAARVDCNVLDASHKALRAAFPEAESVGVAQVYAWDGPLGLWKATARFKDNPDSPLIGTGKTSVGAARDLVDSFRG